MMTQDDPDWICDSLGCESYGAVFNDDGEWLCEDCFDEWLYFEAD